MLNRIIEFSVRNKLIVGLCTLALIAFGVYETTKLPIDAVPDITDNQVQVITVAPSYGATDIERLVTFPVEQANSNIAGIKEIRSFSRFGLSVVTIVFDEETDVYWARQQVAERLQKIQAQIPQEIGVPEMGPISTGLGEIYQYVVRPAEGYEHRYDVTELRTIQDWIIRRQLLGVKGVAEVSSFGGKLKQYEIAVNTHRLQSFDLTIDDVFNALRQNNQNTGGAYIERGPTVLFIRTEGLVASLEDIENIVVKVTSGGAPVLIRDVADVRLGHATRYGAMCYNDKGEVAGAVVMMLKGANSSRVIKDVKERIEQIQKMLPEGVIIEPFLDRTKMVKNAISTVERNLLEGALIVVFILVLFLGNIRAGLLVASVIPLSMLFAIIMMNVFGVSGNLMSLGALDFGLIVDGAVIIVEAVLHQVASGRGQNTLQWSRKEMDEEVKTSASRMMNSAVFGQIIILIVYLPIFTLHGVEGKMFKPMAQTVSFALIGAFLLSLTYIPMMSALVLSTKPQSGKGISDRMMQRIGALHQRWLKKTLARPKTILAAAGGLFALAIGVLSTLGGEFIPALEEGDFAVDTRVLIGSNLNTTVEYTQKAAHVLLTEFPEVEKVVTKIGSGEVPTDPMPMEASDLMVILKDKDEWTSASGFPELAEKMSKALRSVPGITTGFQYPVQMRFNELMTGARQDVVCKIFGEDLDTLAYYAHRLAKILDKVEGVKDLYLETITGMPEVKIKYDRSAMAQYGLNIEDVNRAVRAAFAGEPAGQVFEGERRFDLVVRLDSAQRKDVNDIEELLLPTLSGSQIPLKQVASAAVESGPNQIQREDAKRRIIVGFNVRGRDVQSIVKEVQSHAEKELQLPAGYYVSYGGSFENLNEAKQRLAIAVPVSLLLIFCLLYFAFGSVKQGLLIYSAIPLSAIGGIFFLALRGMPFSISAGVGFIALFGVAVLNGIVLIAEFNRLKKSGIQNLQQIVLKGTEMRLRPVLMTATVASLGFLPMALSNGAGAEVQRPLATVVIGGLILATFLTLFVLPVLYVLFEGKSRLNVSPPSALLIVFLFLVPFSADGQTICLQQAVDTALKNNLTIKNQHLVAEYQQALAGIVADIPQTNISAEAGQINSAYPDNRIGVAQSISFPTVYVRQRNLWKEEWNAAMLSARLGEAEIRKNVTIIFYRILILREREKLLYEADSLCTEFARRAALRLEKGETSVLENASAQLQQGSIREQLREVHAGIELEKLRFRLVLNTQTHYEPVAAEPNLLSPDALDTTIIEHPSLQLEQQRVKVAVANLQLERSRLLPELGVGVYSQTLRGTGADDKKYDGSQRFTSGQVAIGIPLFFGAQRSRIIAARKQRDIAETSRLLRFRQLETERDAAIIRYENSKTRLAFFEAHQLPQAKIITQAALAQFAAGDINYLEWVMLNNQAQQIQHAYLDAIDRYNNEVAELIYLTTK